MQLPVLTEAGLRDDAALAAAGWEPVLLAAVDRSLGWGWPIKEAAGIEPFDEDVGQVRSDLTTSLQSRPADH